MCKQGSRFRSSKRTGSRLFISKTAVAKAAGLRLSHEAAEPPQGLRPYKNTLVLSQGRRTPAGASLLRIPEERQVHGGASQCQPGRAGVSLCPGSTTPGKARLGPARVLGLARDARGGPPGKRSRRGSVRDGSGAGSPRPSELRTGRGAGGRQGGAAGASAGTSVIVGRRWLGTAASTPAPSSPDRAKPARLRAGCKSILAACPRVRKRHGRVQAGEPAPLYPAGTSKGRSKGAKASAPRTRRCGTCVDADSSGRAPPAPRDRSWLPPRQEAARYWWK